jgi:methylglutaconyl-CoA hydratase
MTYTQIQVTSSKPGIATVVINRAAQRNALSAVAIQELSQAFAAFATQDDLRCVLFTGSGTEAFCAGADLQELQSRPSPTERRNFFESIAALVIAIRQCPVPVVSAVHGFALAGGMGLVAASDIVLASDDAVFGLPEVAIGLAPMVVMSPLAATLSPRLLSYLALTGERISATEACNAGLVTRIVPKDKLADEVEALCKTICRRGPQAVRATKTALRDIPLKDRSTFIFELADRSALVSLGAEATEGIEAFTAKRAPAWKTS